MTNKYAYTQRNILQHTLIYEKGKKSDIEKACILMHVAIL